VEVSYHDPYIPTVTLSPTRVLKSVQLTEEEIARYDCVVIATDHSCFDYEMILNHAQVLVDARNATGRFLGKKAKVIKI